MRAQREPGVAEGHAMQQLEQAAVAVAGRGAGSEQLQHEKQKRQSSFRELPPEAIEGAELTSPQLKEVQVR